jgi:hypothetical protein
VAGSDTTAVGCGAKWTPSSINVTRPVCEAGGGLAGVRGSGVVRPAYTDCLMVEVDVVRL